VPARDVCVRLKPNVRDLAGVMSDMMALGTSNGCRQKF